MKKKNYLILILFFSVISMNGQIIAQSGSNAVNCEINLKTEFNSSLTTDSLFYPVKAYVDHSMNYPGGYTDTVNFVYSPEGILLQKNIQTKAFGDNTYSQSIYTYDQRNLLTEEIIQVLLDGNWENSHKYVYNYDTSKNLLEKQYQKYENDIWIPIETNTFVYNSNNRLIEQYYKLWDTNWIDFYQYLYLYNASSQLIEKKVNSAIDGNWVPENNYLYTYNDQGQIIKVSNCNGYGSESSYDSYSYTNGLLTSIQNMKWVYFHLLMGSYETQTRLEYGYDNYNNCNYAIYSVKSGYGLHVADRTFNLLYNNGSSSFNLDGARVQVVYSTLTDVNESEISVVDKFSLNQNYPNPFNPNTTISFSLPKEEFVTLKIYDILGKEIATLINAELSAGTYQKDWQPKNISSGIYFYRLQAGKYTETRKMSFLK
ncbi:MAG: T9SS type A sorting domain-containing protein [bacterium]